MDYIELNYYYYYYKIRNIKINLLNQHNAKI